MNAADLLARAERRAKTVQLGKLGIEFAFYIGVALALYVAGARHGRTSATVAQIHAQRDTVMDTIRVVEKRLVVDTQHVRVATVKADTARARSDSADRAVLAIADTAPVVPSALVIPEIQFCQQAKAADDTLVAALHVQIADLTEDRDAQRKRAEADERELKVVKPSRFGFRVGAAVGATLALVVHALL